MCISLVAFAHMRTYCVVWEGGVNIRSGPSMHADRIGTRELGDRIETVLRAGNWLKIREIPGTIDCGWILMRSPKGTALLELVA